MMTKIVGNAMFNIDINNIPTPNKYLGTGQPEEDAQALIERNWRKLREAMRLSQAHRTYYSSKMLTEEADLCIIISFNNKQRSGRLMHYKVQQDY